MQKIISAKEHILKIPNFICSKLRFVVTNYVSCRYVCHIKSNVSALKAEDALKGESGMPLSAGNASQIFTYIAQKGQDLSSCIISLGLALLDDSSGMGTMVGGRGGGLQPEGGLGM